MSYLCPLTSSAGPLTLLDQCTFEKASVCGMIQTSSDDADWVHRKSSVGSEDHTLLGRCKGNSILTIIMFSGQRAEELNLCFT